MRTKHNARKNRKKKGSFHGAVTGLVKDGKSFQDVRLEGPKAPIQQDV